MSLELALNSISYLEDLDLETKIDHLNKIREAPHIILREKV